MPNHYHLVVATLRSNLSDGLHRLNGVYAQRFNQRHKRTGHLFGDRFSSHVVDSEDHLAAACEYVLENPVRARLCERADEWPWSASRAVP
jgi:REP element-mobilizing transposase RayT